MANPVILIENLSKRYTLSHQQRNSHPTFRDQVGETAKSLARTMRTIGETKARLPAREEFWALQDVSLSVNPRERLGIIGRNGAGKSTLLKILSRITEPTSGRARITGRVASLLEVGSGFHPELTGRENIFLNGAILGMSQVEIRRKFDEIVAFAEVERFLDTPVKRYSSGMYVRLAFAVAAHLDPEILIIDEVLAVGDAQFQRKCLGKMEDVSRSEGRTILFVSHNMDAILRLCSRCVWLETGRIAGEGDPAAIVGQYLGRQTSRVSPNEWIDISDASRSGTGEARFASVSYSSDHPGCSFQPYSSGPLEFQLRIRSDSPIPVGSLAVSIRDQAGMMLVNADTDFTGKIIHLRKGENLVRLKIENLHLNPGSYLVGFWLDRTGKSSRNDALDFVESAFQIDVLRAKDDALGMPEGGPVTCRFRILEVS